MATYRDIANSEVSVDAPVTQQLMQALRDNIIAIQEGDPSAVTAGKQVTVPTPLAGNNIVALEALSLKTDGNRRANRSFPIYIRKAGTYRAFMIVSYPPEREQNTYIDLNLLPSGQFPNSNTVSDLNAGGVHTENGDNALGLTKIIDTVNVEEGGSTNVRLDQTFTLDRAFTKGDALIVTINVDADASDQRLRILFGLAVSQEPVTYTGAGFDLSSGVTLIDEIDRLDFHMLENTHEGFASTGHFKQKTIVRS